MHEDINLALFIGRSSYEPEDFATAAIRRGTTTATFLPPAVPRDIVVPFNCEPTSCKAMSPDGSLVCPRDRGVRLLRRTTAGAGLDLGGGTVLGYGFVDEDEASAKARLLGGTTTGSGLANESAGYNLFAGTLVTPATTDEDGAPANTALGGGVTNRGGTKDAFATGRIKQTAAFFAGGEATASCGSEGAAKAAFRAALRWKRD